MTFGLAEAIDTGDADHDDSARVWAGSYQTTAGAAGGALNGASSTLARWARSIGGTAAHEAGHNYGLSHGHDTTPAPGEDARNRHIMPQGGLLADEDRAGYRRHFSDRTFSLLASNVGLSVQTMHNWDLTNPNATAANAFRLEFLSASPSLTLSWSYAGGMSPWVNPTVSGPLGTTTFKGQTYNRYRIDWSTPQAWSGGNPGAVPGGAPFHVGATFSGVDFNQPEAIIITRSQLLDAAGSPMTLQPRLAGYDAGTLDAADGRMDVAFTNLGGAAPLQLRDVVVQELPRVLSLDAMMRNAEPTDWTGELFEPWAGSTSRPLKRPRTLERGESVPITVARLGNGRHILERVSEQECDAGDRHHGRDVGSCRGGINVDLFPATTLYIRATVVDPLAVRWDPGRERYVRGVESRIYYQVGGRHPDLNRNEVDDAIDIALKTSEDRNGDGVPDEAQRDRQP